MNAVTKSRARHSAIWATIVVGAGSALAFLPPLLGHFAVSAQIYVSAVGYGILFPGYFLDMLISKQYNFDLFAGLVPPVSWVVYFVLFYVTFSAFPPGSFKRSPPGGS